MKFAQTLLRSLRPLAVAAPFLAIASLGGLSLLAPRAHAEDAAPAGIPDRLKVASPGCEGCHAGIEPMHPTGVAISCVGCHGGNGQAMEKSEAHVHASDYAVTKGYALSSKSGANAVEAYGDLMNEKAEYVRFINPGDLRVAEDTCGSKECHLDVMDRVKGSIMATSANVPAAVLWDNGAVKSQAAVYGEAFTKDGTPAMLHPKTPPTEEQKKKGALPFLRPLARWEATSAPDIFRIFDRGNNAAGTRDRGTDFKIAAVYLNIAKTRLNDPALWLPGTNGGTGDYRQSGCSACHILYANDSDATHNGPTAGHGNLGRSASNERSVPRGESGHPLIHQLTRSVPLSQCLTCHHHQGNGALTTYAGAVWHDQETEVETLMAIDALPGGSGQFALGESNDQFHLVQFADFHGHKWNFRKVFKQDRRGNLLDKDGKQIDFLDAKRFEKAVHLQDIHLEKGMQCIDCHTERDVHGDGNLYGAMVDAIEIRCEDCHGTASASATLETTGAAAGPASMKGWRTPFGDKVFVKRGNKVIERSKVHEGMEWVVPQLVDFMDASSQNYDQKAARAHGMRKDGTWGGADTKAGLAHDTGKMECFSCHSSWNTNCYGCHLPLDLNIRAKDNHTGMGDSRGYAQYNAQLVRTDSYTLGINGDVQGNKWCPVRSASAAVISAKARNRQVVVQQQPTISSCGLSGAGITPNIPHTVRKTETKGCSDCHLSADGDNNAVMASLIGLGTNGANWVGDFVFVAADDEIAGIHITEGYEPRPVIGSDFHKALHPGSFEAFRRGGRKLTEAATEKAHDARSIAVLGEFAIAAEGNKGIVAYDIANIANKDVAQKIVRKPTTFIGQSLWARTPDAAWVALPNTLPTDDKRMTGPERGHEPKVANYFRYAYVADRKAGLVVVDVGTLTDGDPQDNRLKIVGQTDGGGKLVGAEHVAIFGDHVLLSCGNNGIGVVNISDPKHPKFVQQITTGLEGPKMSAVQFRYAFVADQKGVAVLDVTDPEHVTVVPGARVGMDDARSLVPYRMWLYVANGKKGISLVDITRPEAPAFVQSYDGEGAMRDVNALVIAATNASTFAYVADGTGGMKVVSLVEPARVPGHFGFSPAPSPKLIATWKSKHPVLGIADGMKRDRFVDEAGSAIVVGGRIGSRPLNLEEMRSLYMKDGKPFFVRDEETRTAKVEPTPAPVIATPASTPVSTPTSAPASTPTEEPHP